MDKIAQAMPYAWPYPPQKSTFHTHVPNMHACIQVTSCCADNRMSPNCEIPHTY